jgi:hypothetical protein
VDGDIVASQYLGQIFEKTTLVRSTKLVRYRASVVQLSIRKGETRGFTPTYSGFRSNLLR